MALVLREDKGSPLTHEEMDENWRLSAALLGSWNATVAYTTNDLVAYNGVIYRSLTVNTNKVPPTNGTDWTLYTPSGVVALKTDLQAYGLVTITDVDHTFLLTNRGKYHRYTVDGAKTGVFNSGTGTYAAGMSYTITNRATADDLTLSGTGVTLNPPNGGTLVLAPGDTRTVKFISATEADVY